MRDVDGSTLVGRAREREAIAVALRALPSRRGDIVAVEGEPGIGKSRLLAHLAARAAAAEAVVLGACGSEFETDLPYALWTEALDRHLADVGPRRLSHLGLTDAGALANVLPSVGATLGAAPALGDRHRTHRALRDLLERLSAARPLVVWFDDVHWGDPASVDALAALLRRPPAAPVLFAVASREGQMPPALALALAGAHREQRLTALNLAPLDETEAAELVGDAAAAVYPQTGGNPFYLEQLARVRDAPRRLAGARDGSVPPAVAAALAAELAALAPHERRVLDAAAVAGDPFDPGLAAAIAELPEPTALRALDELLVRALVRPAGAARRFTFRHPIVRHTIYLGTPPGWRLAAHSRAAAELERHGAGPVQRAHHIQHAARTGDQDAIALLSAAATELQSPAPAIAARFLAAALRLVPDAPAERERQARLRRSLADAHAAAGDPVAARQTLLDALRTVTVQERLGLTVALANQEWWLGGHDAARRHLHVALGELPAQPSADRIRLRLALALTALMACNLGEAQAHASDARDDARAIADPAFELAALAVAALAGVSADGRAAADQLDDSAAALERLTADQLATRLPALWMHGRARRALGQLEASAADLQRGAAIAEDTGRERVLLVLTVESVATLVELGRLREATAAGEEGVERARLAANPRMLLWAHCALSSAHLAAGDVAAALQHAGEAARLDTPADFHAAGQPGWCLAAALTAAGNPQRAIAAMQLTPTEPDLSSVLPVDRPAAAADVVEAQLATGDIAAAEATLARGETAARRIGTAPAVVVTGIARTAVLLARGRPHDACAAAARATAVPTGPLISARARLAEGRALAAAGERGAAIAALLQAESALAGLAARRQHGEAVRELRRLGHRVMRPAAGPASGPLTAREQEIAELIATGRTNREVAEQLVLSPRTIDAHLRNVYAKLGVRSRVELARRLQRTAESDAG